MELKLRDRVMIIALLLLIMCLALLILSLLRSEAVLLNFIESAGKITISEPTVSPDVSEGPIQTPPPTPKPTPTPIPIPTSEPTPALREKDELLILVNPWNIIPEDYTTELMLVNDDGDEWQYMDARCGDALLEMVYDCAVAGNAPYICSGYRTMEKQQYLFGNKIARLVAEGISPEEAPEIAAMSVAVPGTSEHQLGLAVDIIDYYYTNLDRGQEDTSTQQWLMENSWRYGFILRYPNDKSDITGIIYEPWHYRYVGCDAAREMFELGLTLEEYLKMFYEQ